MVHACMCGTQVFGFGFEKKTRVAGNDTTTNIVSLCGVCVCVCSFVLHCLFLGHHALVKGKFLALQDVSVASSSLSRSGGDLGEDTSRGKLGIESRVQGAIGLSSLQLLGNLGGNRREVNGLAGFGGSRLFESNFDAVVCLVPGLEGVGINHDNASLDESLGTDQFVVGGVVHDIQDTDLAGADLGTPGKVSTVEGEGSELGVSSSSSDLVDASLTNLGHGSGSTHEELSLLAELGSASSGLPALVSSFASDTLSSDDKKVVKPNQVCCEKKR